jgi:hypothetical protein
LLGGVTGNPDRRAFTLIGGAAATSRSTRSAFFKITLDITLTGG